MVKILYALQGCKLASLSPFLRAALVRISEGMPRHVAMKKLFQTLPLSSTSHDNQLPVSARRQHTNHDKKGEELEARKLLKAFAFATLNRRCSIA